MDYSTLKTAELYASSKIFGGATDKHQPVNMGDTLINYMAEDSENKIEAQLWKGIDDTTDTKLKQFLYDSDFITERAEAARYLSFNGNVFVALLFIDKKWVAQFFEVMDYEVVKTEVKKITARSFNNPDTFIKWEIKNGKVDKTTTVYEDDLKTVKETTTFTYPNNVTKIPGKIIRNNPKAMPDWIQVMSLVQELNLLSNDIGKEWENIKTIWSNVGQFGKGVQGANRQKQIENGARITEDFSNGAKFAQQFQTIISGSTSLPLLIQSVVFLEDRVLKYAFQGRDSDQSGTNKHNMQVGLFNQSHSEYLSKKMAQRERDFERFFNDIVKPIVGTQEVKIQIQNSVYEQGKEDGLKTAKAQNDYFNAQAEQAKAQAEAALKPNTVITP